MLIKKNILLDCLKRVPHKSGDKYTSGKIAILFYTSVLRSSLGDQRKKRGSHGNSTGSFGREKGIHDLYSKQHETVGLLAELLAGASLTDTTVLHASSAGVSPFFVENVSELQLSALKLVTTVSK